jgi:hypothetical protein
MSTFKLDTSQPIRTTSVKKITRHGTRVRGIEKKNPYWYLPTTHRVPEDPPSYREEVEK